jgi:hypothetical protein
MDPSNATLPPARWGKPWFHPKYFGYGAGLPCSWEGWVVLIGFIVAIAGWAVLTTRLVPSSNDAAGVALLLGGTVPLVGALLVIAWGRTSGGWRWR